MLAGWILERFVAGQKDHIIIDHKVLPFQILGYN